MIMFKRKSFTSLKSARHWATENLRGKWSITSEVSEQHKGLDWVIFYHTIEG